MLLLLSRVSPLASRTSSSNVDTDAADRLALETLDTYTALQHGKSQLGSMRQLLHV